MKLRCPYCQQVFEPQPSSACPHCGKTMHVPARLRMSPEDYRAHLKHDAAERRRRRREHRQQATSGVPAWLSFTRNPRYLAVLVVLFVLLGILLVTQAGRHSAAGGSGRMTIAQWLTGRVGGGGKVLTARERADESLATLRTALELFHKDCNRYPSNRENLAALIRRPKSAPGWDGPYIKALWPDPWKHAYAYSLTNGIVRLSSSGPDGIADTGDDIFAPPPDMVLVNRIAAPPPPAAP